ncbi:espin-like isoform X2 [Triticum urartu]|nr:espin-like isoform X2 [Triticum urartu]XP_048562952.1 espin-like isoform X2 [Triticum urartu]
MELIEKEGNDMVASFRDSKSRTLLHLAARKGKADICSYLISEVGIDVNAAYGKGQTALKIATDKSHMETVECLLNNGADPSVLNIGPTILCMAAKFGRLGIMKLLLDKGVNVDAKGFEGTALACAARCRQICAVKFLIEHGAKVQPEPEFNSVHEVTPLSCAVSFGSFECFDLLIEAGADPKFIKNPLHAAAASGSIKLVDWFLKYGADPDYCDHVDGLKPIQVAAQRKHVDIVEFLFPWTTEISDILNWSVAGIIETYAENKPLDVSHKETTLRRISSTKMNVSILSDEEINLKIKAMVPETEYQFFSKWSAAKKRLFYESTLYGLPEPNRIFNYDVGEIKSSVIFDITSPSPTKVQASYLRAISVYRFWHFAGSDTVYELGPGGNKVTVSRADGTFIFWFRNNNNDVGVVIDGQSIWISGFVRRSRNDDGSFSYNLPIHFSVGMMKQPSNNILTAAGRSKTLTVMMKQTLKNILLPLI